MKGLPEEMLSPRRENAFREGLYSSHQAISAASSESDSQDLIDYIDDKMLEGLR